jgi:hypothetical protein
MKEITKVSDIEATDVAEYIRLDEVTEDNIRELDNYIEIAKAFIRNYTGRDDLDEFQDFVIVTLILCQDMWDNRVLYVDENNLNYVVETILGMHSVNLL